MTSKAVSEWPIEAAAPYVMLDSLRGLVKSELDSSVQDVGKFLKTGLNLYPELADETVYVGVTYEDISWHEEPVGAADPYNNLIYLNERSLTEGYQTLCHELMHLLIYKEYENGKDVPRTSEEYCSIRTIARMKPDLLYRDDIAYLGKPDVPKDEWPKICKRALEYRKNNRNYIQKTKEWLEV